MTSHKETFSPSPLMNVDEVAAYLGMTSDAVRMMVHRRQLPFFRLGKRRLRFDLADINAWLEENRVEAAG